ncbi:zinc ribbon domain-containing protein [uncultured Oscillibacter sp.]|uniref:zinc ribbon domain-containing protein n=1 Tax=uncultured Oscillibacter sp. TaxID=876091 RepID=UPI0025F7D4B0|nr:zinc ribbon domain-containing protein [uncultured Oscillibacter sp.]
MNEKLYDVLNKVQDTAVQVGGIAADAAYGVGRRAEELLSVAKLRVRVATLEGAVEGCMAEIGEMLYATHTGTPTDSEILLSKLEEIDGLKAQIAELQARIGREAERPACPTCGAAVRAEDRFCRECGGAL